MDQHDLVKLTREQRVARGKAIQQASAAALREHFTGDGAKARILRFGRDASLASAGWTARLLFAGSWVVIGGLLVGPKHDFFLGQVHAWMVATPLDQVLDRTHAMFVSAAIAGVQLGLLAGIGQTLLRIVRPAADQTGRGHAWMGRRGVSQDCAGPGVRVAAFAGPDRACDRTTARARGRTRPADLDPAGR